MNNLLILNEQLFKLPGGKHGGEDGVGEAVCVLFWEEPLPQCHVDHEGQLDDDAGDDVEREQIEAVGGEGPGKDLDPVHDDQQDHREDLEKKKWESINLKKFLEICCS